MSRARKFERKAEQASNPYAREDFRKDARRQRQKAKSNRGIPLNLGTIGFNVQNLQRDIEKAVRDANLENQVRNWVQDEVERRFGIR